MSQFTAKVVDLLNKFTKTQPALVLSGTSPASNLALGDMIALGASVVTVAATWNFATHGGAIAADIDLKKSIPAGAIINGVIVDYLVTTTSAGVVQANLKVGTATVATVVDLAAATAPAVANAATVTVTKVAATSPVYLDLNTTAATAGRVRFLISYQLP